MINYKRAFPPCANECVFMTLITVKWPRCTTQVGSIHSFWFFFILQGKDFPHTHNNYNALCEVQFCKSIFIFMVKTNLRNSIHLQGNYQQYNYYNLLKKIGKCVLLLFVIVTIITHYVVFFKRITVTSTVKMH